MHAKRIILCGGLPVPEKSKITEPIRLNLQPDSHDHERVMLRISDLHTPIQRNIPRAFEDLVEIAAYVYSADQAVRRSYQDTDTFGAPWRQHLHFHIPVRCPDIWRRADVLEALTSVLEFLGDHFFSFEFSKALTPVPFQQYIDFTSAAPRTPQYDRVVMFSGGLDSLAGAIDEITQERHRVAFVTHIPTPKNRGIIRNLRTALDNLAKPLVPLHVGIEVNKAKSLGKEYTQRTRSFLFASLGATVAQMLGLSSLRFYENGIVSLNLPLCGQVVGGRASRTTHPRVLAGFSQLFSLLNDSKMEVTNPYLWLTKAQIIKRIVEAGQGNLIAQSVSCAHTWERSNQQTHCGKCSQCLDRRLAMLAAGAFDRDPAEQYKFNIFTEAPSAADDKMLVASYIERARTLQEIKSVEVFIARYPELVRALAFADGLSHQQTAQKFLDLHQRHGREVGEALETITRRHIPDFINHRLPDACLLRIVIEPKTSVQLVEPPAAQPQPKPSEPEHFFRRVGKVWEVRFGGGERSVLSQSNKGCEYLHYLIENREESFSARDLFRTFNPASPGVSANEVFSPEELENSVSVSNSLADAGDMIDMRGRQEYKKRLGALALEIADAQRCNDAAEVSRLESEREAIISQFSSTHTKKGKSRKMLDSHKRTVDAIGVCIRRALKEISESDPHLAAHLSDRKILKFGPVNSYTGDASLIWVTNTEKSVPRLDLVAT